MTEHKPVLLKESIELLNLKAGDVVIDATLGGGGHSLVILDKIGENGKLIAIDMDEDVIEKFKTQNSKFKVKEKIFLVNDNFANLENILKEVGIGKVNAILADLGWSSDQLEGRGMSFRKNEELDMRLDRKQKLTVKGIVNEYSEEELGAVIREYGEEKFWKNITRKIVEYRKNKGIKTTGELAEIISKAIPKKFRHSKINSATRTFQALRIEVNKELENLEKFIPQAIDALIPTGRLAIISFHSLEDRIVKNRFRENARGCILTDDITGQKIVKVAPEIKVINKKPIVAGVSEIVANSRARSAKLRVCEKIQTQK